MGDWVIQPNNTWDAVDQTSGGLLAGSLPPEELDTYPLTTWQNEAGATGGMQANAIIRFPESGDRHKVLQTRGYLHWLVLPTGQWTTIFGNTWRGILTFRITRMHMDPNLGLPVPVSNYNLHEPISADDEFVWEREVHLFNLAQNEWTGSPSQLTKLSGTIPVVAKYNKVLEKPEVMVLAVEYRQFLTTEYTDMVDNLTIDYRSTLRTYVQPLGG